jgi:DNA-binding transcriptional MerR regulator
MTVKIKGADYFQTTEACRLTGISRSTLIRWQKAGIIENEIHRDRRGWRVFTNADIEKIKEAAGKIE